MKQLLFFASLLCSLGVQAQVTGLSVEIYAEHDGSVAGLESLAGYTTYHVYANTTNPEDFVSAVFGDSESPMGMTMDGDIFNSTPSFNFAFEANPMFFPMFPLTEYDSWLTIGMLNSNDAGVIGNIGLDLAIEDFTASGSFYIDDPIGGSWYNTIPCDPAISATCTDDFPQFGGADNKVLLMQITTNGTFNGVLNLQVFLGGDQDQNVNETGLGFSNVDGATFGCTNPAAANYDAGADFDDYSCVLPCTLELVIESITTPTCSGDNDGAMVITATGAQGSDDYYLGEDDEQPSNFGNFNNLIAGSYYVMVEDGAGCQVSQYVEIPEVAVVEVNAVLVQGMTCNNANDAILEIEGMGGDGNLQYYFAGDDPSTMSDMTTYSDLGAGSYTVIAVDGNGCTGASIAATVNNPPAINVYVTASADATCADIADGQIIATAVGGAAPTTLDFLIDGVVYASSPIYISAGTYTVEAIDVNGCLGAAADQVVIGPDAIEINASATPVECFDEASGTVSWAPTGGAENFNVSVDGEAAPGSSLSDLAVGFYTVSVADASGCTASEIVEVLNADQIIATADATNALCYGSADGSVVLSATGGTGTFQYSDDDNNFGANNVFYGLVAGDYVFYVQDENGCEAGVPASITEPAELVVTGIVTDDPTDNSEGAISVNISGGTPDYSYEWSGPGVNGTNTQDLDAIGAGTYTLEVTDGNGCTAVEQFMVSSVFEVISGVELEVFPNPSNGVFNISWTGAIGGDVQFHIVDALGRNIEAGVWNGTGSSFNTVLDLGALENGVYSLSIIADGIPSSIQLIKTN